MKDSNKELIDLIRERLKNVEELPYKEGAWEAYKAKYEPTRKVRLLAPLWVAAAVAALAGVTFLFHDWSDSTEPISVVEARQENVRSVPMTDDEVTGKPRSEEHTSELQSRENLVCRL